MLDNYFSSQELSIEAYHADRKYESASNLKNLLDCPDHYLFGLENPEDQSEALMLGSAIHAAVLEPEIFEEKYLVSRKFDKRKNEDRAALAKLQEENPGKVIIEAKDKLFIEKIRRRIKANPFAYRLLCLPGEAESSIFWTDDETGVKLKCRPDRLITIGSKPVYISVKTAASARKSAFAADIERFYYDMTEAMYADGIYQRFGVFPEIVWLVFDKKTWQICHYRPDQKTFWEGYELYRNAVHLLKKCRDAGKFPGYQPDFGLEEISTPAYSNRRLEKVSQALRLAA